MALSGSHSDQIFVPPKTMGIDITHHTESLKEKQCCVQKMRYVMSKTCLNAFSTVTLLTFEQKAWSSSHSSCFAFQISTFTQVSWHQKQKVCTAFQLPVPPFCAKGASKQPFVVNNEIMKQFWCYTYYYFVTFSTLRCRWPTGTATRKSIIRVLCRFQLSVDISYSLVIYFCSKIN